jgi:hypothetical protein
VRYALCSLPYAACNIMNMGIITEHLPVKLITAITFHPHFDTEMVLRDLEEINSPIESTSEVYEFNKFTSYYEEEMGSLLHKRFISYTALIAPERLPAIKVHTNKIEQKFLIKQNRQINIDPGYITQAKLILATTKNYSHRIYLGAGIFGDLHMQYSNKTFQPQPWTYPDYKDAKNVRFFNSVRFRYLEQLAEI